MIYCDEGTTSSGNDPHKHHNPMPTADRPSFDRPLARPLVDLSGIVPITFCSLHYTTRKHYKKAGKWLQSTVQYALTERSQSRLTTK